MARKGNHGGRDVPKADGRTQRTHSKKMLEVRQTTSSKRKETKRRK